MALFLFGLSMLSRLLQLAIGSRIKEYIRFSVQKKLNGLIFGLCVTILFQSSGAATFVALSLVNAGLLSVKGALPMILGADIGSTITAQLVVWRIPKLSPLILLTGFVLFVFENERLRRIGEGLFYFGLLLFGILTVSMGSELLRESPIFSNTVISERHRFTAFFVSFLFAFFGQSSAVPITMVIIMAQKEMIVLESAIFCVLGANLGVVGTPLIGSLSGGPEGKKVALGQFLFKGTGILLVSIFSSHFYDLLRSIPFELPQKIALSHILFNLLVAIVFYPFIDSLVHGLEKLIPKRGRVLSIFPEYLEKSCLGSPDEALLCVKKELLRMTELAESMVEDGLKLLYGFKKSLERGINYVELIVDNLQTEILKYLWQISCFEMTEYQSRRLFVYTSIVHDIERIADHAQNISEIAKIKRDKKTYFSDAAQKELESISKKVLMGLKSARNLLQDPKIEDIEELTKKTEVVQKEIKEAFSNHLERFYCKICLREAGPLYVDILINLEGVIRHIKSMCEGLRTLS
ncbi:MAG: Na/Pi cotransporter family protein [Deltaproteobacteria bacterium]|nr:Na/Pi cotransporter family protein [Deltaproteobacteria bacterium]